MGGIGALSLIGRHRLVGPLLGAGIGWGAAFVALGAWPTVVGAFAVLATAGATHTMQDVSGRTMLHRVVPAQLHGRVLGVLEGLSMLGLPIGSLSVPLIMGLGDAQLRSSLTNGPDRLANIPNSGHPQPVATYD